MAFHINQTEYLEIRTKQVSVRVSNVSYRTFMNSEIILTFFFPYESLKKYANYGLPQR